MADYVTGVKTSDGVKKIDYNALANKPGIVTAEEDGLMSAGDKVKFDEMCEDVKELQDITSQAGTDIEDIKQDMSAVQQAVENAQSTADEALELANTMHGIVTSGDGSAYTAEVGGISALDVGVSFMMIPHTTSTSTSPTLNVNGLGPVNIRRQVSTGTSSTAVGASEDWLGENKPICVTYDGEYWVADIVKTDISDLNGVVPVDKGGTGADYKLGAAQNLSVPTLLSGEKLPDDADLNNYITAGSYYHDEPSNLSHCPVNQCFKLIVSYGCAYRASQTIIQDIIIEATGERLRRTCITTSGEWSSWHGASDYIIEQDIVTSSCSNNGSIVWTYRKWNSGVAECWGRCSSTIDTSRIVQVSGVSGFLYLNDYIYANYPTDLFINTPKCIASYIGLIKGPLKKSDPETTFASFLYTKEQPTASRTGHYSFYRIGEIPITDLTDHVKWYVRIDFHVIGNWKE